MSGFKSTNLKVTIWWEPKRPDVIKVCSGDPRFVSDDGGTPGPGSPLVT